MVKILWLSAILAATITSTIGAQDHFGIWGVTVTRDHMSDRDDVLAAVFQRDGSMAIRCRQGVIDGGITVTGDTRFLAGADIRVLLRVDKGVVVETSGKAMGSEIAIFRIPPNWLHELSAGQAIVIRVEDRMQRIERIFPLTGYPSARAAMRNSCPEI